MDISTLFADAIGARQIPLQAPREQVLAIDALLPLAQRRIRVFDHDLADTGWDSPLREDVLRRFLLAGRSNRLDILLRDTRHLEARLPRLRRLHQAYSHLVSVHLCGELAQRADDPMLIVDERHFVHRFHYRQADAKAGLHLPLEARELALRFNALWDESAPTLPPTTLGL